MYITNLVASVDDERDIFYVSKKRSELPAAATLRSWVGGIEDQGAIGSCTANATCSAAELICTRANKAKDLSRLFNYYCSRDRDNLLGQEGATLRSAVKAAAKEGLPLESVYPYNPDVRDIKPPQSVYTEAAKTRILRYERIVIDRTKEMLPDFPVATAIMSAISEGHPVVVAMYLSDQFPKLKGKNYREQNYLGCPNAYPPAPYKYIGNHAMVVTGYNGEQIDLENSWGTSFGNEGMAHISMITLQTDVYEAWVIKGFTDADENIPPVTYFNSPETVLGWYHEVWRNDVTDVNDEGVQYWAQHPLGKRVFLNTWKYLVQNKCDELLAKL